MSDPLAPITAGRGRGMAFRIGDIPVHVSISFLLVLAFLGLQLADPVLIRPKPRRPVRVPQVWMQEVEAVVDDAADDAIATQARLQWVNAGPP